MNLLIRFLFLCLFGSGHFFAQTYDIQGQIKAKDGPLPFANIWIKNLKKGSTANSEGAYKIEGLPAGFYTFEVSCTGYLSQRKEVQITNKSLSLNFQLEEDSFLDEVVITGTRTFVRKTNSPVIVNVLNSAMLESVQACNLSEGLKFQPGLRVETDCQTCNYTQLRMNGLGGGYSQILINGRPIFSPLTGLYGLEQIPVNMVERIETIRGGGSTLYGSNAIGGVVNIITKIPKVNGFELSYTQQSIKGAAKDEIYNANTTVVSSSQTAGLSLFANKRDREYYDANGDNFSELT
ncbi:MAG: TonB-dependent receptor, partial [Bacteroidota bacterium]|nr:TonB-dependent receptor [Bacteroidota bacterium]